MASDLVDEVQKFLDVEWDPDLTVGAWWEKLGTEGWSAPAWPSQWWGRDASPSEASRIALAVRAHGALGAPGGVGLMLAGPTIVTHGSDEQKRRFLRDILTGQKAWCQLFSEPSSGSDLASLAARAERDGDEWVVNGQKVWTTGAHNADHAMLVARTDADQPKHQGLSWFAFTMDQPGVTIRPLREMTGRAAFNEVHLDDVRVADADIVGGRNNGWRVTTTTLGFERAGLGGGGHSTSSAAVPGSKAGDLDRRAGDFIGRSGANSTNVVRVIADAASTLIERARTSSVEGDPVVRQELTRLHTLSELGRHRSFRQKDLRAIGQDLPGLANIEKLTMAEIARQVRDIGLRLVGPYGTLHGYAKPGRQELAALDPGLDVLTEVALFAPALSILGGTDQIQRNIIAERVLGLPKAPAS